MKVFSVPVHSLRKKRETNISYVSAPSSNHEWLRGCTCRLTPLLHTLYCQWVDTWSCRLLREQQCPVTVDWQVLLSNVCSLSNCWETLCAVQSQLNQSCVLQLLARDEPPCDITVFSGSCVCVDAGGLTFWTYVGHIFFSVFCNVPHADNVV